MPENAPYVAQHPGALILAALDAADMTQTYLAFATGLTLKHINQVVRGHVALSPEVAVRIERELDGIDARVLMYAQADCDVEMARACAR